MPSAVPFTFAGVRHGFLRAQPMALGILFYGVVFGVLAASAGLTTLESLLMSATVYSGSAQLAALQAWSASPLVLPLAAAVLMMNARYILYGAALRPWLGGLAPHKVYPTLYFLGDGNWALSMKEHAEGRTDAGFVLGSGFAMFMPWLLGTAIGHLGGSLVADPAAFGLDFMLAAFSTALMNLMLVPTQMVSGPLADWMGYKSFFLFVVVASIPSIIAAWKAPFPNPTDAEEESDSPESKKDAVEAIASRAA